MSTGPVSVWTVLELWAVAAIPRAASLDLGWLVRQVGRHLCFEHALHQRTLEAVKHASGAQQLFSLRNALKQLFY